MRCIRCVGLTLPATMKIITNLIKKNRASKRKDNRESGQPLAAQCVALVILLLLKAWKSKLDKHKQRICRNSILTLWGKKFKNTTNIRGIVQLWITGDNQAVTQITKRKRNPSHTYHPSLRAFSTILMLSGAYPENT